MVIKKDLLLPLLLLRGLSSSIQAVPIARMTLYAV